MIWNEPYKDGMTACAMELLKDYQQRPGFMMNVFIKFDSPLSMVEAFYTILVNHKQITKLEDLPPQEKSERWHSISHIQAGVEKKVKICKMLYLYDLLIYEK